MALGFPKPPESITAQQLFAKLNDKVRTCVVMYLYK